ncbi:MAG: hypothetical protein KJ077_11135 [Anaerolineae bacterium]|nr:hypothetical protein [Anaerolineae bacterium]
MINTEIVERLAEQNGIHIAEFPMTRGRIVYVHHRNNKGFVFLVRLLNPALLTDKGWNLNDESEQACRDLRGQLRLAHPNDKGRAKAFVDQVVAAVTS